jgi:hypothetical protein
MARSGGGKIYESMEKHLGKLKFDAKLFLVTTIITKVPFGNFVNKYNLYVLAKDTNFILILCHEASIHKVLSSNYLFQKIGNIQNLL